MNPVKIGNKIYANRMGNGDDASGDGYKYRGRGYIQLTGKENYEAFNKTVPDDVVSNPDLVGSKYPLASAGFFFNNHNLWAECDLGADTNAVIVVTRRVNGGVNGLTDRQAWFDKIWRELQDI
jgi:putative chitinase